MDFMRKFGYLESNPMTSEAIYHEDAIVAAIKNVQKYGALNETGIVDEETLQVRVCYPKIFSCDLSDEKLYFFFYFLSC